MLLSIINTIFYYLDILQEYKNLLIQTTKPQYEDGIYDTEYLYEDDILIIFYHKNNKQFTLILDRTCNENPKIIVDRCLRMVDEEYILAATLNGTDITDEMNGIFGPRGEHLNYYDKIKIEWFLTPNEIDTFDNLAIVDIMCENYIYNSVNRIIQFD